MQQWHKAESDWQSGLVGWLVDSGSSGGAAQAAYGDCHRAASNQWKIQTDSCVCVMENKGRGAPAKARVATWRFLGSAESGKRIAIVGIQ